MTDLISRKAAIAGLCQLSCGCDYCGLPCDEVKVIEQLLSAQSEITEETVKEYCYKRGLCIVDSALLKKYACAQTELLTDREQRIFLAAMTREKEVCKRVDAEWRNCKEPYEDSLVKICHEIIRKVKGALWTGKL